ncbi:MAG: DUF3847 domain-containing protein [Oscillospiraceae bacterium]|nr:DUF3847 domain-containing protein [Oscillospiraceae bacterium]
MSKKNDVDEMRDKLARLNERTKSAEDGLKKLEDKRKKIQNQIAEEERKKRTHNLCSVGGLVYKYFGDDISPEEFKEMLDFLFAIDEVQDFVTKEKEKRFLRDNQPVVISENTNSEKEIIESDNVKIENA